MMAAIPNKGIPVVAHPAIFRSPRYLKVKENVKNSPAVINPGRVATAGMKLVETRFASGPLEMAMFSFLGRFPA